MPPEHAPKRCTKKVGRAKADSLPLHYLSSRFIGKAVTTAPPPPPPPPRVRRRRRACLCCSRCWSLLTSVRSSMAVVAALVVGPVGGDHGGLIDQPLPVASAAQGMASSRCCRSVHRWTEKRQSSARRVLLVPEAGAGCCGRALGRTGGLEGVVWSVQDEQRGCRGGGARHLCLRNHRTRISGYANVGRRTPSPTGQRHRLWTSDPWGVTLEGGSVGLCLGQAAQGPTSTRSTENCPAGAS